MRGKAIAAGVDAGDSLHVSGEQDVHGGQLSVRPTSRLADQPTCENDRGLTANGEPIEHLDVLIVGAGLSGIGAAHHLQEAFPGRTYAILEARDASGGTWDLFRYPGVR